MAGTPSHPVPPGDKRARPAPPLRRWPSPFTGVSEGTIRRSAVVGVGKPIFDVTTARHGFVKPLHSGCPTAGGVHGLGCTVWRARLALSERACEAERPSEPRSPSDAMQTCDEARHQGFRIQGI